MITSVAGTLVSATPLTAVVEAGGLGYEIHIPVTTAERLPAHRLHRPGVGLGRAHAQALLQGKVDRLVHGQRAVDPGQRLSERQRRREEHARGRGKDRTGRTRQGEPTTTYS